MSKYKVISGFVFAGGLLGGEAVVVGEGGDDGDGGEERGVEAGVHPILSKVTGC